MSYKNSQIFLLTYAVNNQTSFDNITEKWEKEVKSYLTKDSIVILVATKVDTRDEENSKNFISHGSGEKLSKTIKANLFFEVSAKENIKIQELFKESIRYYLDNVTNYSYKSKKKSGIFSSISESDSDFLL
jgi:GTPase SAR1 family protein